VRKAREKCVSLALDFIRGRFWHDSAEGDPNFYSVDSSMLARVLTGFAAACIQRQEQHSTPGWRTTIYPSNTI